MTVARSVVMVSMLLGMLGCHGGGSAAGGHGDNSGGGGQSGAGGSGTGGANADASRDSPADMAPFADGGPQTVVLTLASADGAPITGITSLVVTLSQDATEHTMTFPHDPQQPIASDGLVKLSVGLAASTSGMASIKVDARNAAGCGVATRLINFVLLPQATIDATVSLIRGPDCPDADAGADAGAPDAGGAFPGCAAANPDCPDQMVCQIDCTAKKATCTAGGSGPHGATCASNADCAPGTQCFDYGPLGCAVKICRRYCDTDGNCPQPLQAALGKNTCAVPITCPAAPNAYNTCTLACDPTWSAAANGTTSCPDGLSCLLLDADHADCACPPAKQIKTEGSVCVSGDECAPGLVCNMMGGTKTCRALCKCYADGATCGAPGDCPAGTHCSPLTNGVVNGVCLAN
jgi:hypothetical protein